MMLMNETFAPRFRCASRNARRVDGLMAGMSPYMMSTSRGVSRAALRFLERESRVREIHGSFDFARLVADDDYDWIGLDRGHSSDCARNHRLAAKLVQDLGALRSHPGPFAGGEDDRGDAIRSHRSSRLSTCRRLCAP